MWDTVSLQEVCSIEKEKHAGAELPYVGMEDIESGTGRFLGSLEPRKVKSNTFHFTPNQVLYGRLRPYLNKVLLPEFEGHCSTEVFPIQLSKDLNRHFLFYWFNLDGTISNINDTSTGARMPRANMKEVINFNIPLPPFEEQKRIVEILDEAFIGIDQAIANTEKNLHNARELFESLLNAIFTQKGEGWETVTVEDIAQVKGGKRVPKGYELQSEPTNHPYIAVADFEDNGTVSTAKLKYISDEVFEKISRYTISSNDVYISIAGTIGKTGIIPDELEGANLTENACKLVLREGVSKEFVYFFTKTHSFIEQATRGTRTAAQPKLALTRIKPIKLRLPSLSEQNTVSGLCRVQSREIDKIVDFYQQKLEDLAELKQSLLQKAFSGELTRDFRGEAA